VGIKKDFIDMLRLCKATLLLAVSALSFNLTAEIYTWTDKNGKVHFSDKPTTDEKVTTMTPKENNNISDTVTKSSQWQQDYNQAKQDKAEQSQKHAIQVRENKDYCEQLKRRIAIINQGGRIYVMSPEGEREFKSETQLKTEHKNLTQAYKQTCR
jgi:Tfp pilus assembly protein FimT